MDLCTPRNVLGHTIVLCGLMCYGRCCIRRMILTHMHAQWFSGLQYTCDYNTLRAKHAFASGADPIAHNTRRNVDIRHAVSTQILSMARDPHPHFIRDSVLAILVAAPKAALSHTVMIQWGMVHWWEDARAMDAEDAMGKPVEEQKHIQNVSETIGINHVPAVALWLCMI